MTSSSISRPVRLCVTLLLLFNALLSFAQNWPQTKLRGATFRMPGRPQLEHLPDSLLIAAWTDSAGTYQFLCGPVEDPSALNEGNLQSFYALIAGQVEQGFRENGSVMDINSSAEVRVDGLPGRSTSGEYQVAGSEERFSFRYDVALSGSHFYFFSFYALTPEEAYALEKKFFASIDLPADPVREKFQTDNLTDARPRREPFRFDLSSALNGRVFLGLILALCIGWLLWFTRTRR